MVSLIIIFVVGKTILELPPLEYFGEAEKKPGGECICGKTAIEADCKAATPTVEAVGGHVVIFLSSFHGAKLAKIIITV